MPILTVINIHNQYYTFVIVHYYYVLTKPHSILYFLTQCDLSSQCLTENTTEHSIVMSTYFHL